MIEKKLTPIIEDSFLQFAGAVLQSRALVDVRDCLKPSARQIFYCMETDGFIHTKPFQKTLKSIGSCFRIYIHGDSSAEGVIMRAGQPFAMRYPLVEIEGSYGTLIASGSWAAPRYTSARLSKLSEYLFSDIKKDTISDWRDNYDNTEQYPAVLPSKGFYNLVNGTFGLGVGASSSIPQYNLKELNNALIYLIDHPDCSFDDIYVAPDFATGATIINGDQVKESHRNGTGFACKIRSTVEWDEKERCFIVTEIPFMVYTETICKELEEIVNGEDNPGIERFNDLTGKSPLIKIYLEKKANPDKVLKYLYKNTSLQSYFGINFTMLDMGRFPKVFTWKEMLQAHIAHEREVYQRGFEYDLKKIKDRLHIVDGLIKAISIIDEVVATIRSAADTENAKRGLIQKFNFTEIQAKAILEIKLARLAHLEITKLQKEQNELKKEQERIETILSDEELFKNEIKRGWREVAEKFGDDRRTKIINLQTNDNDETTEIKRLQVSLTNKNNVLTTENSTLFVQKRGGVGNKQKMEKGEYIIASQVIDSNESILFFSTKGNVYHCNASSLVIDEKIYLSNIIPCNSEKICAMSSTKKDSHAENIIFITKNGIIKKSLFSEYNMARNIALKGINLDVGDEIVDVIFTNKDNIGLLTEMGNFIIIRTDDIRPISRVARGIKGINLNDDDHVASARVVPSNTIYIASISGNGLFKKTEISEFSVQGRGTKGNKIQKVAPGDWMADFLPLCANSEVVIASTRSIIRLTTNDIPSLSKNTQGNKSVKLEVTDNIVEFSVC